MPINVFDSVDKSFLTLAVIVALTGLLYRVMGKYNRPMVLGGLVAGFILTNLHLPKAYIDIDSCSEIGSVGIVLFMMSLGVSFDLKIIHERRANMLVSLGGLVLPLLCGIWFSSFIFPLNHGSGAQVPASQFALLIGLSMSIAAFTLVSLFLSHANILDQKIGHVGLLAASMDDVFFWIVFGGMLVFYQTNEIVKINQSILFAVYLFCLIFIFPRIVRVIVSRIKSAATMMGFLVVGCFLSAVIADAVDLHQICGAFAFGLMLPRDNPLILQVRSHLDDFVTVFLLPVFFAKIGAMANITLFTNSYIIVFGLLATIIAFAAKFFGIYTTSRILGYRKHESAFLASLLNMRGVVEVVMMKVAWEVGLITIETFTVLIIMALATTWLATALALYFKEYI